MRLVSTPEDAMLDSAVDAVIIAVDDIEESLRLCRAATQAEKHVVIIPPLECSPAFSFELHLILDESRHAIVPLTGRFQLADLPAIEKCLPIDRSGILQIAAEIPIEISTPESRTITILQGLDILSASGFDYTQVTALESLAPDGTLLSLLITLNSQSTVETPAPPATLMIRPRALSPVPDSELRIQRSSATVQRMSVSERAPALPRIDWLFGNREACSKWMESFSISLELAEAGVPRKPLTGPETGSALGHRRRQASSEAVQRHPAREVGTKRLQCPSQRLVGGLAGDGLAFAPGADEQQ
jgi:hypothetical protein